MRRMVAACLILLVLISGLTLAVPGCPDKDGMLSDLDLLLQWGDRASGSRREQSAAKFIEDRFKELGLQVETQSFTDRGIQSQNVIGTKPGSDPLAGVITVTAHYDSAMPAVPGANDNASGTVVMMELARLWSDRATSSTIQFIAFGAEERGLLGARHYITTPKAQHVVLNLNLDMVGKGGKVGFDRAPAWLTKAIAQSAQEHGFPFELHYATLAAMRIDGSPTDGRPFADKGIPTVSFASAEGLEDDNYHSAADNRANVNGEDLLRLAVVVNDLVERYDGQKVAWGDRNFIAFTVLNRLVVIPGWVSYLLVLLALLIWGGLCWSSLRGERGVVWAHIRHAAVRWIGMIAVVELIAILRQQIIPGKGYPWHYILAVLAATYLCWVIARRYDVRKADLLLLGIPVVLILHFVASAAWDYALMTALVVIPAALSSIWDCRWRRLICWVAALMPFLYFCTSNWLPRAGTIRAILEFAYIPALAMITVQMLQSWAKAKT